MSVGPSTSGFGFVLSRTFFYQLADERADVHPGGSHRPSSSGSDSLADEDGGVHLLQGDFLIIASAGIPANNRPLARVERAPEPLEILHPPRQATARTIRRCIPLPRLLAFHSVFYGLMFAPARSRGTPDSLTRRTPSALPEWLLNPRSWGTAANRAHRPLGDPVAAEGRRRIDPDAESRPADTQSDNERDVDPMILPRRSRVLARLRRRSSW
jgi:hypothetical protein